MSTGPNQKQSNDGNLLGSQERKYFLQLDLNLENERLMSLQAQNVFENGSFTEETQKEMEAKIRSWRKHLSTWDKPHGSWTYLWIFKFFLLNKHPVGLNKVQLHFFCKSIESFCLMTMEEGKDEKQRETHLSDKVYSFSV